MPTTTITLLGESYSINAEDNDVETLKESALLFDRYLQDVKQSSNIVSSDKIELMAGLNLAREFVTYKQQGGDSKATQKTLERLCNKMGKEMESITPRVVSPSSLPLT